MKVRDIMKQAHVVDKDISFGEAAKIMSSLDIGSLIVVKDKKMIGIITAGDILDCFGENGNIFGIMKKKIVTIESKEDIDSALALMKKNKVKHLPVVDGGNLAGIITMTDIAENADELEGEF